MVLTRSQKMCNFLEYNEYKIVYKRYIIIMKPLNSKIIKFSLDMLACISSQLLTKKTMNYLVWKSYIISLRFSTNTSETFANLILYLISIR